MYGAFFLVFIIITTFILMNLLVGILVENVSIFSQLERDSGTVNFVRERLPGLMKQLDDNEDGCITAAEVQALVSDMGAADLMESCGVDVSAIIELANFLL